MIPIASNVHVVAVLVVVRNVEVELGVVAHPVVLDL